jgi:hypothetical protein
MRGARVRAARVPSARRGSRPTPLDPARAPIASGADSADASSLSSLLAPGYAHKLASMRPEMHEPLLKPFREQREPDLTAVEAFPAA